jgi:quinol monooxygenase YgiN
MFMAEMISLLSLSPTGLEERRALSSISFLPRVNRKWFTMVRVALFVRLEAKAGKENEVAQFLASALPLAQAEETTPVWFALRLGPSTFAIFDAFPDDAGRTAHLQGAIAKALLGRADELLAAPPIIDKIEVIAAKVPQLATKAAT